MKMLFILASCALSSALVSSDLQAQSYNFLDPLTLFGPNGDGSLRPGDKPYVTIGGAQRGLSYNPQSGYLVFIDRAAGAGSTFSGAIYVLDWLSGDAISTLTPDGIQGGDFANMAIAVADDGAIYLGNQVNNGATSNFKLYRWTDDITIDPPVVAFEGDPGNGWPQRWGDTMDIRGAGTNTQIILGSRTSGAIIGTNVAILTTVDGTNFTARTLVLDVSDSATGGSVAFGATNTFWAKNVDVPLRQFAFDLSAGTATILRSYGSNVLVASRTLEALAVNVANNWLAIVDMTSGVDNLRLYDIADSNNPPVLLDIRDFPVNNANGSNTKGYLDFGSDFGTPLLFVHNMNNGLLGFAIQGTLMPAPILRSQPASQRVLGGRTVSLEVLAYPAATYQWQRNGANVNGATNAILRLVNSQPSQAGTYRVLVSNEGGTTISDEAVIQIINPADLFHLSPLWSKTPANAVNGTNYATLFGGASTPNERSIAYNSALNELYIQQKDGTSTRYAIHVVDAITGNWLRTLNTNGIVLSLPAFGGANGIALVGLGVAEDGAIYASDMTGDACGCANPNGVFRVYRWANSDGSTLPVQIFQGDPAGETISRRWGDVMSVRGSGINTEILMDNQNPGVRNVAILRPAVDTMTTFTNQFWTQAIPSNPAGSIGRTLQFGSGDTFWQKRTNSPLFQSSFDATTTTVMTNYATFPSRMAQVAADFARNLVLGIHHAAANSTVPDTLDLFEFSEPNAPLVLAQYNFPIPHQNNANFIGHLLLSGDKVFALSGNNGIIAFRIVSGPQSPPTILGQPQDVRAVEGNPVSLSVISADLATFQWQLNSNNIPGATSYSYAIPSAAPDDGGSYRVIVSNDSGSVTSQTAMVTVLPAAGYPRLSPLWSLAPLSRPYLRTNTGTGQTPFYRGIAYNALSNQVYLITRSGANTDLEIHVLDASTGADLYQLNTSGIISAGNGGIILLAMAAAEDGALYAADMSELAGDLNRTYNLYRWANSDPATVPTMIYSGDPGAGITDRLRWGDTLDVRGAGMSTEIFTDANSATFAAIFKPTDETMAAFAPITFPIGALAGTIGRSLQYGPGDTVWQKRKGARLQLSSFELTTPSSMVISNFGNFPSSLGPLALDPSRNLLAGIDFASSATVPDTLALYEVSDLDDPLLIARYDFPTNQQPNANFIGQVLFAGNRVWAVDGNNGILAFTIVPPSGPPLSVTRSGSDVLISWDAAATTFSLQRSPTMALGTWVTVSTIPDVQNGRNIVTENASTGSAFYRLCEDCP